MMVHIILAALLVLPACAGEKRENAGGKETGAPEPSVTERAAGTGKKGTYIAGGSFSGGEITDGRDVHRIAWSSQEGFERLEIRIHEARWGDSEDADPVPVPCSFTVRREDFPARLHVTVSGTRMFSASPPALPADGLIKEYYRIVYLDDSGAAFAFDVDVDTEFEVFEMHDPAVIVIDVRKAPGGRRAGPEAVFSLRSASWPAGEGPGHFQEKLMTAGAEDPRIIRDAEGGFCVEEGWYPARAEAKKRQEQLAGEDIELFIERRGASDRPRHIILIESPPE